MKLLAFVLDALVIFHAWSFLYGISHRVAATQLRFNQGQITSPEECILIMESLYHDKLPNKVFVYSGEWSNGRPVFVSLNEDGSHGGITMEYDKSFNYNIAGEGVNAFVGAGDNEFCPQDGPQIYSQDGDLPAKWEGTLYNAMENAWTACLPQPLRKVVSKSTPTNFGALHHLTQCARVAFSHDAETSAVEFTSRGYCYGYSGTDVELVETNSGTACIASVELIGGVQYGGVGTSIGTAESAESCAGKAKYHGDSVNGMTYDTSQSECVAVVGMKGVADEYNMRSDGSIVTAFIPRGLIIPASTTTTSTATSTMTSTTSSTMTSTTSSTMTTTTTSTMTSTTSSTMTSTITSTATSSSVPQTTTTLTTTMNVNAPTTPTVDAPTTPTVDAPTTPTVDAPTTPNVDAPTTPNVDAPTTTAMAMLPLEPATLPGESISVGAILGSCAVAVTAILGGLHIWTKKQAVKQRQLNSIRDNALGELLETSGKYGCEEDPEQNDETMTKDELSLSQSPLESVEFCDLLQYNCEVLDAIEVNNQPPPIRAVSVHGFNNPCAAPEFQERVLQSTTTPTKFVFFNRR